MQAIKMTKSGATDEQIKFFDSEHRDDSGTDFEGRQHDALADARNTAHLFQTVRVPDRRESALGSVIDAMKEKTLGSSLGDLFDFGALCFAS